MPRLAAAGEPKARRMKKLIISLFLTLGLAVAASAQCFTLSYAKEMPSFEGAGIAGFEKAVNDAAIYPSRTAKEGTVTIGFYVSKEGATSEPKVLKGLGKAFDNAALDAVRSIDGTWTPALDSNGAPLDWFVTLKVQFKHPQNG